eukprot:scaffold13674_cov61-Phaeocystis_antarctica.AAC.1
MSVIQAGVARSIRGAIDFGSTDLTPSGRLPPPLGARAFGDRRRRRPSPPPPPAAARRRPSASPSPSLSWSRRMPQLTLFGKPASQPAAPAPAAKKAPASSAAKPAPKGKAKASTSRTNQGTAAPASSSSDVRAEGAAAELDSAARAHAVWAAHRTSQVTGISARPPPPQPQPPQAAADRTEARLLGTAAPCAGGSTTLERMQAQERQLVEQHVASRARPLEPKKKAYTAEAGWRRTSDGERAFVTASGKRLTGKVAHAAAKRLKS